MCNPLIAAAAIAAVSTGVGIIAENQAANAHNSAVLANNAERKKQIDQAATQEINDRLREMRREQSRIQVATGEAGLSLGSGSIEALLRDSAAQAGLATETSLANRESRKRAADTEAQSQLQSKTSALGAGLQIALSAGSAYMGTKRQVDAKSS